ncbi:MAG: FAD-dependent monooxygenase [Lautropia sp.]
MRIEEDQDRGLAMTPDTSVLIVGGGLNGLTMAALLARLGVDCLVAERHRSTSIQYKFAGISPRSMEVFRQLGLEEEIRANRTGDQQGGGIARGRTLTDPDLVWGGPAWPDTSDVSPTPPATCDQHVLEPILKRAAERRGAGMRFGWDCIDVAETGDGIQARLYDRADGREEKVTAHYLVAADGTGGTLRDRLGISLHGPGSLQHWMNIIFDTDMPSEIGGKRFTSFFATDLNATVTPRPGGRWLLALQYLPEKGESPEDFDAERTQALVGKVAGRDVRADLVDARPWMVAAQVAGEFRKGPAFLIGDCAHLMPPTGAFGGNTGIHDAHNLAWKLALVLQGAASPGLLDSYDAERRPVVERTLDQALARLQKWFKDPAGRLPPAAEMVEDYDVVFGQRYDAGALILEGAPPHRPFEPFRELSGRPGTRLPHVALDDRGLSTLDLANDRFLLLSGGADWASAARDLAEAGAPIEAVSPGGEWPGRVGIARDGALLIRPDGFVAWRARGDRIASPAELRRVLNAVLAGAGARPSHPERPDRRAS